MELFLDEEVLIGGGGEKSNGSIKRPKDQRKWRRRRGVWKHCPGLVNTEMTPLIINFNMSTVLVYYKPLGVKK